MTEILCQVSAAGDSALPRDRFVNTLYFLHDDVLAGGGPDYNALCNDLAVVYQNQFGGQGTREYDVRMYSNSDAKPRPIKGRKVLNPGSAPGSGCPREVACCLSFYADRNSPRTRGRIYIPATFMTSAPGARPSGTVTGALQNLAQGFSSLGGVNVDWCVHSKVTGEFHKVTNTWVDDEWDTQRRRGLKATGRVSQTVSG